MAEHYTNFDRGGAQSEKAIKANDLLSFKPLGRPLDVQGIEGEYRAIQAALGKELTAGIAQRVCEKSGEYLLKLVSPRADGEHAILNVPQQNSNHRKPMLPSVNAADIPYAKVLYRPLEVHSHPTRSLIDHILKPDNLSEKVYNAFATVFGDDVLDAARAVLTGQPKQVEKLAAGEFPIIFIPNPNGGDIQITPVSPAISFMGMKEITSPFFQKQERDGPKVPRGKFNKQTVSSKPQNISGAIGGPRNRLLAEMPPGLKQTDAELYSYVRGGRFPRWRAVDIDTWVLRYDGMLKAGEIFNNKDTRTALARMADRLIHDAERFAEEVIAEAHLLSKNSGIDPVTLKAPPQAGTILLRRRWATNEDFQNARRALSHAHFQNRLHARHDSKDG